MTQISEDLKKLSPYSADQTLVLVSFNVKLLSRAQLRLRGVQQKASDRFLSTQEEAMTSLSAGVDAAAMSMIEAKASCSWPHIQSAVAFIAALACGEPSCSNTALQLAVAALGGRTLTQALLLPSDIGFGKFMTTEALEPIDMKFKRLAQIAALLHQVLIAVEFEHEKLIS